MDEREPLPGNPGRRLWHGAAGRSAGLLHPAGALLRTEGDHSLLATAIGADIKGKASPLLYCLGIGLSFAGRWLGIAIYVVVALMWLIPDPRLERRLTAAPHEDDHGAS